MKEELRCWELELEGVNIRDLALSIHNNKLVAIVDEEKGGIIGYVLRNHSEEILKLLNSNIPK